MFVFSYKLIKAETTSKNAPSERIEYTFCGNTFNDVGPMQYIHEVIFFYQVPEETNEDHIPSLNLFGVRLEIPLPLSL